MLSLGLAGCSAGTESADTAATDGIFPYSAINDLPKGLRLVTVSTGFPDVVVVSIVVTAGSRNEVEAGKSGFAHCSSI
jgi:zinc protease